MYLWGGKGGIRKRLTSSSSNDSVPLLWERDLVDQAFPPISRPLKKWFDPQYPIPKRRLMGISKINVTINARAQTSYIKSIVIHLFTSPLLPPPSSSSFSGISWWTFPVWAYKYSTPILSPISLKISNFQEKEDESSDNIRLSTCIFTCIFV